MSIRIENYSAKEKSYNQEKPVFAKADGKYEGHAVEMSSWRSGAECIVTTCGKITAMDFVVLAQKKCPEILIVDKKADFVEVIMGKEFTVTVKGGIMINLETGEASSESSSEEPVRPLTLNKAAYDALSEDEQKHYTVEKKANGQFSKATLNKN